MIHTIIGTKTTTISTLRALGDKTITIDKRLRFSTTFMFNTKLDTMMMLFALGDTAAPMSLEAATQ